MHTPAYRRLYVHVPCTYELCSSAKLPSSLAEHWQCAFAVGFARDATLQGTCAIPLSRALGWDRFNSSPEAAVSAKPASERAPLHPSPPVRKDAPGWSFCNPGPRVGRRAGCARRRRADATFCDDSFSIEASVVSSRVLRRSRDWSSRYSPIPSEVQVAPSSSRVRDGRRCHGPGRIQTLHGSPLT